MNLGKYSKMIANSNIRDDLDEVTQLHRPERAHILIDMPSLNKDLFWSQCLNGLNVSPDSTNLLPFILYNKRNTTKTISSKHFEGNYTVLNDLDLI